MSEPTFSIVVATYRRPEALRDTVEQLSLLDYPRNRYDIIIVDDNGGDDTTVQTVSVFGGDDLRVRLEKQSQRGAAAARNMGARVATGEFLLFCDDDILVTPDHLKLHVADRHDNSTLLNGTWEFAPRTLAALQTTPFGRFRIELERRYKEAAGGESYGDGLFLMPMLGSWNLSLRRDLFWDIGGFDDAFPVAGAEDQDFSLRARSAGCTLLLDANIRCLHNDNRLTLNAYCDREERSARTMPFLADRHPDAVADSRYVLENRRILLEDGPRLMAKKSAKRLLSSWPVLNGLRATATLLEALGMRERTLQRLYSILLGLHLFRGFRQGCRELANGRRIAGDDR